MAVSKSLKQDDLIPGKNLTTAQYISYLKQKKLMLNRDEIGFIVDFIIQLVKHASIKDENAISLATHLLSDMHEKSHRYVD